jgi:hypothetical protein
MQVHIEVLRPSNSLSELLRKDGWRLDSPGPDDLVARHPNVTTESLARSRLNNLGLLTSRKLRIRFVLTRVGS